MIMFEVEKWIRILRQEKRNYRIVIKLSCICNHVSCMILQ